MQCMSVYVTYIMYVMYVMHVMYVIYVIYVLYVYVYTITHKRITEPNFIIFELFLVTPVL